jgi:hypothetical protein
MRLLKQSTAFTFRIGPFVDATDGVTAETGLTIAQADIQISKAGGAFAQTSASPTTTHDADGWYQCPLTATDTNTLGALTVQIVVSGAAPVWEHFMVLPAQVYDSLVGGTDLLDVNASQLGGTAQTGRDVGASVLLSVGTGTGQVNLDSGNVPIRSGLKRNTSTVIRFPMRDTTGAPLTGSTVTVTYAHGTATSFSATSAGTATEAASGFYFITLTSGEMNAATVQLRMAGSGGSGTPADNGMTLFTDP